MSTWLMYKKSVPISSDTDSYDNSIISFRRQRNYAKKQTFIYPIKASEVQLAELNLG